MIIDLLYKFKHILGIWLTCIDNDNVLCNAIYLTLQASKYFIKTLATASWFNRLTHPSFN